MNIAILIPAYQPDENLAAVVASLMRQCDARIIVVDDGSGEAYMPVFSALASLERVTVLTHAHNQGKGRALKTAIGHCLAAGDIDGCVTVDADGQHRPEDVVRIMAALRQTPGDLILGSRDFDFRNVPLRSRLGNIITRFFTRFILGQKITDTQTGLRAFSKGAMTRFAGVPGERYEYEMNMLLYSKRFDIKIREIRIETVYLDHNSSSHFNPLLDSIRIYRQIFAFGFSSIASAVLDWSLFSLCLIVFAKLSEPILLATIAARLVSLNFNFAMNRKLVFRSESGWKKQALQYYILAAFQMLASGYLVRSGAAVLVVLPVLLIKICVDLGLFVLSYQIQKTLIFKRRVGYGV
jgi:glycosyltransferase involved in cell wall biosynthesis